VAVTCPRCGTVDTGRYCSTCGTVLPNEESRTWLAFVDSFFKFRDLRRYFHTYWHILASPTRNTLALAEEGNSAAAFQFLQTSLFIYTVAVISKLITGGLIVSQVVIPLILLISFANFGAIFYWFARRKSPRPRSGREFLILCSYSVGLAIPFAALVEILQPHATSFLVAHTSSFWLPLLVFTVVLLLLMAPLYLYVLRVWGRFWELEALTSRQRALFEQLRARIGRGLAAFGMTSDRFGMIHADLVPENILVDGKRLRIIDFDDAGFGWHMFEIATSLYFIRRESFYEVARDALIAGYRRHRRLPDEHLHLLPMFLAARGTTYLGWVHTRKGELTALELTPQLIELAVAAANDYLGAP